MVAHKHKRVQVIVLAVSIDEEELEEFIVVGGLFKNLLALVPARDHVVECAFKLYARFPWHGGKLSR